MDRTERTLEQGQALVRAIEALDTIEPTGPFERAIAWLQLQAYRCRLSAIVQAASRHVTSGVAVGQPAEHEPDTDVALHRGG